jgi:hypothetical protein
MKMTVRLLTSLALLSAMFAAPAVAESYKFTLHNESKYPITGFQTYEDGKWSTWSGVSVDAGESQGMDWNSSEGDCVVPFRVIYKDVETEQYKVDWCKISNIRVHDDSVTAD